jgi:PHD/YefM family antitoxin component YafN of YafNO toxin-antitoxin module
MKSAVILEVEEYKSLLDKISLLEIQLKEKSDNLSNELKKWIKEDFTGIQIHKSFIDREYIIKLIK